MAEETKTKDQIPFAITVKWAFNPSEADMAEVAKFTNEFFESLSPEHPEEDMPKCVDSVTIKRI